VKLKISKDTDRLIKHIFNFHLNMRQICCSPTTFVSTVISHDPLDRKSFGSHGIKNATCLRDIQACIGCSFKFILKVAVEESIVNPSRITDHGSAV
jgi:hypothetical protein